MTEVASTCRVLSFTVFFLQRDGKREKEREREGGRGSVRVPMADWLDDYAGRPNRMRGMGGVEGRGKGLTMLHHTCIYETGERKANTLAGRFPPPSSSRSPSLSVSPGQEKYVRPRTSEERAKIRGKQKKKKKRRISESYCRHRMQECCPLGNQATSKKAHQLFTGLLVPVIL